MLYFYPDNVTLGRDRFIKSAPDCAQLDWADGEPEEEDPGRAGTLSGLQVSRWNDRGQLQTMNWDRFKKITSLKFENYKPGRATYWPRNRQLA
jgi:hypothetical protein